MSLPKIIRASTLVVSPAYLNNIIEGLAACKNNETTMEQTAVMINTAIGFLSKIDLEAHRTGYVIVNVKEVK